MRRSPALAVIKLLREPQQGHCSCILPQELRDNWITYNSNVVNNPSAKTTACSTTVLTTTPTSRARERRRLGAPPDHRFRNWGAYGLVVIDEPQLPENGGDSRRPEDKMNRYQLRGGHQTGREPRC